MSDLSEGSTGLAATVGGLENPPEPVIDWEQDGAFIDAVGSEFDAVEASLRRLDSPLAGRCEVCGNDIGRAELMADPLRVRCDTHLVV